MLINNLTLNFQHQYYLFYDWLPEDNLKKYGDIYLVKVSSKILDDLINYQVHFIGPLKKVPYIFTDSFSCVAVKFDDLGYSVAKSSLLLKDEEKVLAYAESLKYTKINYEKVKKDERQKELRFNLEVKTYLEKTLKSLDYKTDADKIKYLYYEWYSKVEDDTQKMLTKMLENLNSKVTSTEINLYNLLRLSNKVV